MMLRALLIDDEPLIVENLSAIIPWQEFHFEWVGSAQNGLNGLDLVKEYHPDLILCDIRMPKMDGLTFLQKLNQLQIHSTVIMLTGFAEFEYARKALQYGARDLLLKPINYAELEKVIADNSRRIRTTKSEHIQKEKQLKQMQDFIYEKLMTDLLFDEAILQTGAAYHQLDFSWESTSYTFLLVDLKWSLEREGRQAQEDIRSILQQMARHHKTGSTVLQTREGEWCILVQYAEHEKGCQRESIARLAHACIDAVENKTGQSIKAIYYPETVAVTGLSQVYKELQRAIHFSNEPVYEAGISTGDEKEVLHLSFWKLTEDIIQALKRCDTPTIQQAHTKLLHDFKSVPSIKLEKILHFLLLHLFRELKEMSRIDPDDERTVWECLESKVSLKDLFFVLNRMIAVAAQKTNPTSNQVLMDMAMNYIDKNAANDLSVEEMASYLGLSSSHFCVLFKQHFKETFVEYLTRTRLEWAKTMLLHTDLSISNISKRVGYLDRRYFNKVFSKWVGVTPNEYRVKHG